MMVPLSPEATRLTRDEIIDLCNYNDSKDLGGVTVNGDERVPASGWDPDVGEHGLLIPYGSRNCVMMHVDEITGIQQAQHNLVLAGSYVALHAQLRERDYVVGVTYAPLARLAVRAAGFSHIKPYGPNEEYQQRIAARYATMRMAKRVELALGMVYMPTDQFISTYSVKRLGRDAEALLRVLLGEDDM